MAQTNNYDYNFPHFPLPPPHSHQSPPIVFPPPSPPNVAPPHNHPSPPKVAPPHYPIPPPRNPPSPPKVAPPHYPIPSPPPPYPVPVTPPNHPSQPPNPAAKPPRHSISPPIPIVTPPTPYLIPPPPPPSIPPRPPTPGRHSTVIVIVFVSFGGLFFLAFLSVALCCFIKKRKKKTVEKTEIIDFDEHMKVQETIVPGPQGEQIKVLEIEEDVHILEEIKKNVKLGEGSHIKKLGEGSHIKSSQAYPHDSDIAESSTKPHQHHLQHKV